MRFFLDNDVPASVGTMLRSGGHECWTAAEAGLADAQDDDLTVYAQAHRAVLVTLDREFSKRRRKNPIGHHVWLRCPDPQAAAVFSAHLEEVLSLLHRADVTIEVSAARVKSVSTWD